MPHAEASITADAPLIVRLLLDARSEFRRVAEAVPNPGRGGAIGRLNPGSFIVAHVASRADRVWNVGAQDLEGDAWLAEAEAGSGAPRSTPLYAEAVAALDRAFERSADYIAALTVEAFDLPLVAGRRGQTHGDQLARCTGHIWAHAGELATLASLVGAPDLGLPGALAHSSSRVAKSARGDA